LSILTADATVSLMYSSQGVYAVGCGLSGNLLRARFTLLFTLTTYELTSSI